MSLVNCLGKNKFLKPGEKEFLTQKAEAYKASGMSEREAEVTAIEDAMAISLQAIQDASNQASGVKEQASTPFVTPPAPPQTPPSSTESAPLGPEQGNRQTVEKLQEESKLDDTLKEAIEDFQKYTVHKQEKTQSEARRTIDRLGEEEALREATSFKLTRSVEQKIALLSELAERFSTQFREATKKGDTKTAEKAYDRFMATMDELSARITDAAQAVSYMNLVGRMFETKTGAVRFATRQIDESREGAMRNHEDTKLTIERVLEEFDKLSKEDFMKSRKVQELMADVKKTRSIQSRIAHKQLNDAATRLKSAWDKAKQAGIIFDPKSQAANQVEMTKALIYYIQSLIKTIIADTGETIKSISDEVKKQTHDYLKEQGIAFTSKEDIDAVVDDEVGKSTFKQLEKKYKKDLKTALTDFANGKIKNVDELVDQISATEQLTTEQATDFAKRFKSLFDEYATEQKQKLIKKYTPKAKTSEKTAKQKTEFYDKIIQLSNVGAVSDRQMDDALAQIFGLPSMTPEIASKIEEMVDKINKAPEGRFKNIAITELTDYIAQQQKFNITDYLQASFKAGLFSGITTQGVNNIGNASNVMELGFAMGITNPKLAARFFKAFANPKVISRAFNEAIAILKTGYDPRFAGDNRRVLEQRGRSFWGMSKPLKGFMQVLDPSLEKQKKFVFRALQAGDAFFSLPIGNAISEVFYYKQAKKMGLRGAELDKYVREQMGYTPENMAKKIDQAKKEADQGIIPNDKKMIALRAHELIEQERDPNITAQAKQYASQQIMTNTPTGLIGLFAQALNTFIAKVPALSAIIPVVNFAGNAMNRGIQYLPSMVVAREIYYGVSRKIKGEDYRTQWRDFVNRRNDGDFDTELRIRRAVIGFAMTATLLALLSDDEEDENMLSNILGIKVKIHGSGPGTKHNKQKNYDKAETGWEPYSVQIGKRYIPYKNYPGLNILLAGIGEMNDAVKYNKMDRNDALNRLGVYLTGSVKVLTEMGFFTSLNTMTQALLEGDAKIIDVMTRTASNAITPNFQRDIVRFFDNNVYSKGDIQETMTRSIPVVNMFLNEPIVNSLGEPIEKNVFDRLALWRTEKYSKYDPIWETNNDKNYTFPKPTQDYLSDLMGRPITTKEYNEFFKLRGEGIVQSWKPEWGKLSAKEYDKKMDRKVLIATYNALVKMGVMKSDINKELLYMLDDINEVQRNLQGIKKEIFR